MKPGATHPGPPRLELRGAALAGRPPVTLTVGPGEMVAVDGWDSSELLAAVAGLQPLAAGEVRLDGTLMDGLERALAAGVAMISVVSPVATLLTAYENVLLPLAERGTDPDPPAAARRALDAVGLAESANHLIEDLSGGQQQRVAVARAVAAQPRLLLADQATTDLDAGNRNRVIGLLRDLVTGGSAVLLTSDDPAVVAACDRVVRLDSGNPRVGLDQIATEPL